MSFEFFMKNRAKNMVTSEVVVSDRFIDDDGKNIPFTIKGITAGDDQIIRNECFKTKILDGETKTEFDNQKYQAMLCAACVVYPDLANKELQDSYGAMNKIELLRAMLLPGEFDKLFGKVTEVCGFKKIDKLVEEAKN